jgi:hypothetical protein
MPFKWQINAPGQNFSKLGASNQWMVESAEVRNSESINRRTEKKKKAAYLCLVEQCITFWLQNRI